MRVSTISRVIGVGDMDRAIRFYRDTMGLEVVRQTSDWTDLTCGNGNLSLQTHQPELAPDESIPTMVIFTVDDLDAAIAEIEMADGRLLNRHDYPNAPVIVSHVRDTEGNDIQVVQLKERSA